MSRAEFPDLLRAAAVLIQAGHGPGCADHDAHEVAAGRLVAAAVVVESGGRLSVAEVVEVEKIVRRYRDAVEVPA